MRAEIYQIGDVPCGKLAIMPRPRAGDWLAGEIDSWRQSGIECVVSLLASTSKGRPARDFQSDTSANRLGGAVIAAP